MMLMITFVALDKRQILLKGEILIAGRKELRVSLLVYLKNRT